MAEVHIIGHVSELKSGLRRNNSCCKWFVHLGNGWKLIAGRAEGQSPTFGGDATCTLSSPIDLHLTTVGVQGWPRIYLQVYDFDWFGRVQSSSYGMTTLPSSPGKHTVECYTWRPYTTLRRRFSNFFLGGGHELKRAGALMEPSWRNSVATEAAGVVTLEVNVVLRNFHNYGVEYQ